MGDTIIAEIETPSVIGVTVSTSTITLDAPSTNYSTTTIGTTTKTWTHTVSGQNEVVVLEADLAQNVAGIGSIASASWNGGAFTKATSTRKNNMEAEVWYVVATTTGAKTMSVTVNGTTTAIRLAAQSFSGISIWAPFDLATSSYGSGGNPTGRHITEYECRPSDIDADEKWRGEVALLRMRLQAKRSYGKILQAPPLVERVTR